ncbi:hypothetical protein HH1059_00870 [Halorhodospira halochloris]|uniref:Uncharacterized protein n=1 Tax=Halorhodospira halochloris TaxID=1052 RepID=A0A110B4L2_HALHR|nr:TonB-dependent receptor [Halorhodospira halochloris]MBK1650748.1 hypothetical protein [Halorhodospira halochloris]BAU56757.1 hypothetical protein HH1059_00870 [Halorhodospira halochloris]
MQPWQRIGAIGAASVLLLGAPLYSSANEDVPISGDIEHSDRQAIFGISTLGLEETDYRFPVTYCPHEGDCRDVGTWRVSVSQSFADGVLMGNMGMIIPARYDQIILEGTDTRIETATEVHEIEDSWVPEFSFSAGQDFDTYIEQLQSHLNDNIAEPLAEIMESARQSRFEEMSRDEQTRFIEERAQELDIPATVLEELLNSAYTFGFYLPKIDSGQFRINQVQRTRPDGSTYYVYRTRLTAPLKTSVVVFDFDYEAQEFNVYNTFSAEPANLMEALAQRVSGTESVTTPSRPRQGDAQDVFDKVFEASFRDSVIALTTSLTEDRNFAVAAPTQAVRDGRMEIPVGNQENLRPGAPMMVTRVIDGEEENIGWGKIRTVGDTCLVLDEADRTASVAQIISDGGIDDFDQTREHPWTGVYGRYSAGMDGTELDIVDETGGSQPKYVGIGFQGSLAFIFNSEALYGMWANVDLDIGVVEDFDEGRVELDGGFAVRNRWGLEYRYHLRSPLYLMAGADLGIEYQSYESDTGDDWDVTNINLQPRAGIGYYFGPNWKLMAHAGYSQPIYTDVDIDGTTYSVDMEGGPHAMLSIAHHIGFAGPFASMTQDPSLRCQELRDERQLEELDDAEEGTARACTPQQRPAGEAFRTALQRGMHN